MTLSFLSLLPATALNLGPKLLGPLGDGTFWLPPEASEVAKTTDGLFYFILYMSIFFFVLVVGATAWFAWKYRYKGGEVKTHPIKGHFGLEFLWSAVPSVILLVIFVWGQRPFVRMETPPANAMQVEITGQQWKWTMSYPTLNKVCSNKLVVPVGQPVKLTMSSVDVIHSFFIPAFRLKRDVVPDRYTGYWFKPTEEGDYTIFCSQYCGQGHSKMTGQVHVVSKAAWKAWLASSDCAALNPKSPDYGKKLFETMGCTACHNTDGTTKVGPHLNGIWGTTVEMNDGTKVKVDANYVRESLLKPSAKIVKGFTPQMPSFAGRLDDQQINGLIHFIQGMAPGKKNGDVKANDKAKNGK